MLSAFFGYFQSSPATNNTIPTARTPKRATEDPLAISRMAPKAEMTPPIIKSLSFILFVFSPLSRYFHFVNISSLRNVALATYRRSRSTAKRMPEMMSRLLEMPSCIKLSSPPT